MDNLPDEILCMILSRVHSWFIPDLILVCQRWKRLCCERVSFKFVNMDQYHIDLQKYIIQDLFQIENVFWTESKNEYFKEQFFTKYQNLKSITLKEYRSPRAMMLLSKQKHLSKLESEKN